MLKNNGLFFGVDCFIYENEVVEKRVQEIRINGIVSRGVGDPRFKDFNSARAFIDKLELDDDDKLITLDEDIEILHKAKFSNVACLWREYREAVYCGQKLV